MKLIRKAAVLLTWLSLTLPAAAAQLEPVFLVNEAFEVIEEAKSDDLSVLKVRALSQASRVKTAAEARDIVRGVLAELEDDLSFIHLGAEDSLEPIDWDGVGFRVLADSWQVVYVFERSSAEAAGINVGDTLTHVGERTLRKEEGMNAPDIPPSPGAKYDITCDRSSETYCDILRAVYTPGIPLTFERPDGSSYETILTLGPKGDIAPSTARFGDVAYLELPPGRHPDYVSVVSNFLENYEAKNVCGWIFDFRRHAGGLTTAPAVLKAVTAQHEETTGSPPPAVVLVSRLTESAGMDTIIQARSYLEFTLIGEPTAGGHPDVLYDVLSDGTLIGVTRSTFPLVPDTTVEDLWTHFQTPDDEAVRVGLASLRDNHGCTF